MAAERWTNLSPGDLSVVLPEVIAGDPDTATEAAAAVATTWALTPLPGRIEHPLQLGCSDVPRAADDVPLVSLCECSITPFEELHLGSCPRLFGIKQ